MTTRPGAANGAKRSVVDDDSKTRKRRQRKPPVRESEGNQPISLLTLDDDLIARILIYLSIAGLAKLDTVSRLFRQPAAICWDVLDSLVPAGCRSSCPMPRTRVIRFHLVSTFAGPVRQFGAGHPLGGFLAATKMKERRVEDHLLQKFEYFVRFENLAGRCEDLRVFAQGFTQGAPKGKNCVEYCLDNLNLSGWPRLQALMPLTGSTKKRDLASAFKSACLTVVAVDGNGDVPSCSVAFNSSRWAFCPFAVRDTCNLIEYSRTRLSSDWMRGTIYFCPPNKSSPTSSPVLSLCLRLDTRNKEQEYFTETRYPVALVNPNVYPIAQLAAKGLHRLEHMNPQYFKERRWQQR